jgi:hypothetical protein
MSEGLWSELEVRQALSCCSRRVVSPGMILVGWRYVTSRSCGRIKAGRPDISVVPVPGSQRPQPPGCT